MQNCTRTISPLNDLTPGAMVATGLRLLASGLSLWMVGAVDRALDHLSHRRSIAALHKADDRMLKDIGISRADIERLSNTPPENHP